MYEAGAVATWVNIDWEHTSLQAINFAYLNSIASSLQKIAATKTFPVVLISMMSTASSQHPLGARLVSGHIAVAGLYVLFANVLLKKTRSVLRSSKTHAHTHHVSATSHAANVHMQP